MRKNSEKDWIDLDKLPKYGGINNKVKWNDCYDIDIDFSYKDIHDKLTIVKPIEKRRMLVRYKGNEIEIPRDSLLQCNLAYVVGNKTHDFKYKIGDIINFKKGRFLIKNCIYKLKDSKQQVKSYSNKAYSIQCLDCGYEDDLFESKVVHMEYCPCCINRRLLVGYNDMWTTNPEMAQMLLNPEDGYKVMRSSNKPILEWACPFCSTVICKTPNKVNSDGLNCPNCRNTDSYPNRFMRNLLGQLDVDFKPEASFDWAKDKFYDFYIGDYKIIIEMHGLQHYKEVNMFANRTLEEEQENDRIKCQLANSNGIEHYIVIDSSISDFDYIKNNILQSELSLMFDLSNINWIKLECDIDENVLQEVADMWNSGIHSVNKIRKKLNIHKNKITRLLNRAAELNMCDYITDVSQAEGRKLMNEIKYHRYSKPVKINETGECFGSVTIMVNEYCNRGYKFYSDKVYKVFRGEQRTYQGFTFSNITHEEFNHIKETTPELAFGELFDLYMDCTKIA